MGDLGNPFDVAQGCGGVVEGGYRGRITGGSLGLGLAGGAADVLLGREGGLLDAGGVWSGFLKQNYSVGVRALGVVAHAPAVGGLGELLAVDEDEDELKSGGQSGLDDVPFELDLAVANLADFECNEASRTQHPL